MGLQALGGRITGLALDPPRHQDANGESGGGGNLNTPRNGPYARESSQTAATVKEDGKKEEIGKREKVKTVRESTQAPLNVEAIRLKDGEFEERERKRSGRRRRKKKEEEGKVQKKRKWWRAHHKFFFMEMKKDQKKRKAKRVKDGPKASFGKVWKVALSFFLIVGQNWLSVSAAARGQQRRTEAVMMMEQEVQVKEHKRVRQN